MSFTLCVGYSGPISVLERVLDASSRITSVYTGGLAGRIRGGRPQYVDSLNDLAGHVGVAHRRGVQFEVALNAPCGLPDRSDTAWWDGTATYLRDLESIGIDTVIASHPFIMALVKEQTGMEVVASTICEIATTRSARYYEKIGADVIIPSMNANMRVDELRSMKRTLERARLRLMVNEHCLGDCPWRRFHHNHYAHSNKECDYHLNCKSTYADAPYLVLTNSAIRPEDIHHYFDITTDFKIVGRLVDVDTLVRRIQAYDRQQFAGNFVDLLDTTLAGYCTIPNQALDGLLQRKWRCNMRCDDCRHCHELADRVAVVDAARARRVIQGLKVLSERPAE